MSEHPNVGNLRAALEAYRRGGEDLRPYLAEDIVWHVGGDHQLSGDYVGIEDVIAYHDRATQLTGGSLALEAISLMADDTHAGIFLRVRGERAGVTLDTVMAEALRLDEQGLWREFWAQADDQAAVDEFWSA